MANEQQIEYWNEEAGLKWAAQQHQLDAMLAPVAEILLGAAAIGKGERVLDIGCGTGETVIAAMAAGAAVTGVDISQPMLDLARSRVGAGNAQLILADAAQYHDQTGFDLIISRFGVMFFDDPIAAFTNIKANLRSGGRMIFACWQSPQLNHWAMVPMQAVKPFLPDMPKPDPHEPGPFAFADAERLEHILRAAGFAEIMIQPQVVEIMLSQDGGVAGAADFAMEIGPASRALREVEGATLNAAKLALREALGQFEHDGRVALPGAIWIVTAR